MKNNRIKMKAWIFLTVICFQILSFGMSPLINTINGEINDDTSKIDTPDSAQKSYSSPYSFTVDPSDLLFDDSDENEPTSSSTGLESSFYYNYNDYALTINLNKYALTPSEQIQVNLYLTRNLTPSSNTEITVKIYKGLFREYYSYYSNYYDAQEIDSYTFNTTSNGEVNFQFSDTSSTGLYTIFASSKGHYSYREFTVGKTGLFLKGPKYFAEGQQYRAALQVVNLTNFIPTPFTDYSYRFERYNGENQNWNPILTGNGQTDEFGYSIFSTDSIPEESSNYYYFSSLRLTVSVTVDSEQVDYSTYLYKSWNDWYYTCWGGEQQTNRDRFQFVVTTDKTIYTPGETMQFRTLVLEYSFLNETKIPLDDELVHLTVYNPDELAIFWTSLTTDENGIINFQFPLDHDSDLGNYGFEFGIGTDKFRYDVEVRYYEKPVFRVDIDTNGKDFFPISDNIFSSEIFKGNVEVTYYFGQPVTGASVTLFIKDYWGTIKYSIEGETNAQGRFHFSINLKSISDLYYSFFVEANVTDIYSRKVSYEKRYTRMEGLYAYGYLSNWAPDPSENLEYYFYAFQQSMSENGWYEYNALADVPVKIDVYGISEYPLIITTITNKVLLESFESTTNGYGSGYLEFSLPLFQMLSYHFFEIKLSVTLEDGRSTESSTYFRFKKYSLDLDIQTTQLNPGDTLNFTATYTDTLLGSPHSGEGRIYIYDAGHKLLGRASVEISGSESFSVKIPEFSTEGKYYIYSYVYSRSNNFYGGFEYHSAYETFSVGNSYEIILTTNGSVSDDNPQDVYIDENDILKINGFSNVSSNIPYYLEIYKRGLIFSTKIELFDNEFAFELPISSLYGPDFTIMVYTISDEGKIYESALVVHINYNQGFTVTTDKEIYEPGDSLTLTITPADNSSYLLSISFIDSSVLDVKPEDDSELAYFSSSRYYAYIESGSSWGTGINVNNYWWISYETKQGGIYNYGYYGGGYLEDDAVDVWFSEDSAPRSFDSKSQISFEEILTEFETEIRENISESANWISQMIISEPTNISFQLPDNIGEWTIRSVGNSLGDGNPGGNIIYGDIVYTQIKSFLPFFIEFEVPEPVIQDDILSIKAYVYNYLGSSARTTVAIDAPNLIVLNKEVQEIIIPDGFVSEIEFSVLCTEAYLHNLTLLAATTINGVPYSDAKLLPVYIHPNGIELRNITAGYLNASDISTVLDYELDPQAIYHKETLALYTDLMDISIESWKSLIGYPYGCIEQTLSKVLPTALIFNYLNETGQLTPNQEKEMNLMVLKGLNRVYGFQQSNGGWGWWKDDQSKVLMTSIVLSALNQIASAGFKINPIVLKNAAAYLIDNQKLNGAWEFPYYTANDFEATAFTMRSLISSQNITAEINNSIESAMDILSTLWDLEEIRSPYGAALLFIGTSGTPYENTTLGNEMILYIKNTKQTDGNYVYWNNPESYYWRNLGNNVEITSYAAWALAIDNYTINFAVIKKSIQYLLSQQNRWGWRNTADTSAAISSLTAIKMLRSGDDVIDYEGNVSISINEPESPQFNLDYSGSELNIGELALNVGNYFSTGNNQINITLDGTGQIFYVFETVQIIRSDPEVVVPNEIVVSAGEEFNFNISFSGIYPRMPLVDTKISFLNVPDFMEIEGLDYTFQIPVITDGEQIQFSFVAPEIIGDYELEGVLISGILQFNDVTYNAETVQLYRRLYGPIHITVMESSESIDTNLNSNNKLSSSIGQFSSISENIPRAASHTSDQITLFKEISKSSALIPGEIISITIQIDNNIGDLQFYALDDIIPAGTSYQENSVEITGANLQEGGENAISIDQTASGMHVFFPVLPLGITEITYQIQVESLKNSYLGLCTLWGMYDNFTLTANPIVIENIPRKYNTDNSIYRDLTAPTINDVEYVQIEETSDIEVKINFFAEDDNSIHKIRVVYSQGFGWRAKQMYTFENGEFTIELKDLENVDSSLDFFIEATDIYGNIISTLFSTLVIRGTLIPYIAIGGLIALSLGLAGVATIFHKRRIESSRTQQSQIDGFTRNKEEEISFIDETN